MGVPFAPGLGVPCPACGQTHQRCIGHYERAGGPKPCGRVGTDGQERCGRHGGEVASPRRQRARKAAIAPRSKAMSQVLATLGTLGVAIDTDPLDALVGQLAESAGLVSFLRNRCDLLAVPLDGELVTDERVSMHPLWAAWREESERMVRFADLLVRAGFQERQVRVIEQQATLVADLMRRVLDDPSLGLTEAQRQTGRRIAAAQLRLVGGGGQPA